ncbi:hypothetical protein Tco_0942665, partial [Tanacetum coccineum]
FELLEFSSAALAGIFLCCRLILTAAAFLLLDFLQYLFVQLQDITFVSVENCSCRRFAVPETAEAAYTAPLPPAVA